MTDARTMTAMLARERSIARAWRHHGDGPGIIEKTEAGTRQLLAVPDGGALLTARDVTAVGFFGQLRADVDHAVLFEHERRIAQTFPEYAALGFLSYFDLGPEHGRYGNLILFATPEVPAAWRANPAHMAAVVIAPRHYVCVRLHKATIPGPFLGDGEPRIERTTYLDFGEARMWRAVRVYR